MQTSQTSYLNRQLTDKLTGTASQIVWAEGIRIRVNHEFDRVADAFRGVASKQAEQDRQDTLAIIALLEEKRAEVLALEQAGYFIRVWQDLKDQVRQLIHEDSRYRAIRANRLERTMVPQSEVTHVV